MCVKWHFEDGEKEEEEEEKEEEEEGNRRLYVLQSCLQHYSNSEKIGSPKNRQLHLESAGMEEQYPTLCNRKNN